MKILKFLGLNLLIIIPFLFGCGKDSKVQTDNAEIKGETPDVTISQEIDILLKGGHVIDPKNNIDSQMDVAI